MYCLKNTGGKKNKGHLEKRAISKLELSIKKCLSANGNHANSPNSEKELQFM